jgi:predicted nucleic acid-binding protein
MGMRFIGTVGVLELAASNALISLPDAILRLRQTDFRIARGLLDAALARDAQRKGQPPR